MPTLPRDYPKTPPNWLPSWPPEGDIRGFFPEGIRRFGYRILGHDRIEKIICNDNSLIVTIGDQQASWRLLEGQWHRFCTCGYKNDRCAHSYAAALAFNEIIKREQWLHVGAPPERPGASRRGPTAPKPRDLSLGQLPLFGGAPPSESGPCKLEVEADFHHVPDRVTLRFYQNQNNQRQLLRMQQLTNLGMRARQSSAAAKDWSEDDRQFLSWVSGQIKRNRQIMRSNLNVLKLKEEQFDYWVETWADTPGRFIERATQEAIAVGGQTARMIIELTDQGEWIQISAIIVPPNGERRCFHEIFKLLASGRRDVVLDGKLLHFAPPLSWDLMCEVFSRKSPRMRREHIPEHLPNLLEGRLDIVRGDMVDRELQEGDMAIEAKADGADILLRAQVGPALIYRDSATAAGHLHEEDGRYIITTYDSPHATDVRKIFQDVAEQHESDGSVTRRSATSWQGAAMVQLYLLWRVWMVLAASPRKRRWSLPLSRPTSFRLARIWAAVSGSILNQDPS